MPDAGTVRLGGTDIGALRLDELRSRIGLVECCPARTGRHAWRWSALDVAVR
ncbi:hypothetical protein [Streptomyces sp. NPDC051677]|uniref:hypothetical protein n=1 Tax=Streptomyces sp. NPDC051677 TaxID=3365669 RepID=UPI0037D900C7